MLIIVKRFIQRRGKCFSMTFLLAAVSRSGALRYTLAELLG